MALQVAELFNEPLVKHYAALQIEGLDREAYGDEPIYFLVSEYDEGNSYGPDQWMDSWYIRQDDQLAGMLTDFHFRHAPGEYPRPGERLVVWMRRAFFAVPFASVALCWGLLTA